MTDHRQALRDRLARGCFLPAARDHATLLLRIADRRHAERRGVVVTVRPAGKWRVRYEAARDLGTMLLIAAVFALVGMAIGGAQ